MRINPSKDQDLEHRLDSYQAPPSCTLDDYAVSSADSAVPKPSRWRRTLADLTANISFSLAYGPFVDIYVSGRTWEEMLSCRAIMVPVTVIASDYYGRFMDYCFARWGITKQSPFIDKCKGDTATCAMFWAPLYMGVTMANGATLHEGLIAFGYTALMAAPVGVIVNNWMRYLRTCFGAPPHQLQSESQKNFDIQNPNVKAPD